MTRFLLLSVQTLSAACGKFAPFEIKEHMGLAPLCRVQSGGAGPLPGDAVQRHQRTEGVDPEEAPQVGSDQAPAEEHPQVTAENGGGCEAGSSVVLRNGDFLDDGRGTLRHEVGTGCTNPS